MSLIKLKKINLVKIYQKFPEALFNKENIILKIYF